MSAHLIQTSWQRVEPGFELGKSGLKVDVLGYAHGCPRAGRMPIFPPPPGMMPGSELVLSRQCVEAVLRAGRLWGVTGAPGLRTRLSSVTITPAVIFTTSPCVSDLGGLTVCPGFGLALQHL